MAKKRIDPLPLIAAKLAPIKGLELRAIGAKVGVSYDTVLKIRDGWKKPRHEHVQALADYFRV